MSKSQELKSLQVRKHDLQAKKKISEAARLAATKEISTYDKQMRGIDKDIDKLTDKDIVISEHAMLRYIERFYKIDLNDIEQAIISDKTRIQIKTLGNGKFPIGDNLKVVVKNNTVISVIPSN